MGLPPPKKRGNLTIFNAISVNLPIFWRGGWG
jgi:hypothetical protein